MTKHFPAPTRGIVSVRADAGAGDIKATLENLNRSWAAFNSEQKETNSAFAKADVVQQEKLDRMQNSVLEMQAAVDQANAKMAALELGGGQSGGLVDSEYTDAFRAHFRKGDINASLNNGAADEGGYLAPVEWDRTITDKLVEVSPMRQIAAVQNISGTAFTKLFNARGMTSGWVGEAAPRPETGTPTFGSMTYATGELYANPAATQKMLDDPEVDLEAWIASEVETEFSYQEGLAFVSGNGTNKPSGFLTYVTGAANAAAHPWGAIQTGVTAAGATAITADEITDMVYSLPEKFTAGARWVMNRNSMGKIMKLEDSAGWKLWQPSLVAGQPSTLMGYGLTEMAAMPSMTTGAFPIAFGDFKRGYQIVDRMAIRILRDPFSNKPYVHFYTTKRVGGGLLNPEPLKVLKMG